MRHAVKILVGGVIATLAYQPVYADGIDMVSYLTRVGWAQSLPSLIGYVALLMLANYILNFLVIGLPALRAGPPRLRSVAVGLIGLTVLGQLADRLGALVAAFGADPLASALGFSGEGAWLWPLLSLNFLFSGIAVGALARYFTRRRWHVAPRTSWAISAAAAIITNPAWAFGLWFT